jgi:hypothetical protein
VKQWITPRALLLHLAYAAIATGCALAGWWQVHRAMQGNTLSYLYSIEWPAFAVVAGIGWWQMVHDTPEDIAARKAHHERMRIASAEVAARTLPRSATAITVGSQARPATALGRAESAVAAIPAGTPGGPGLVPVHSQDRSLMTRDEDEAVLLGPEDDGPVDQMTEYNRYLALLAIRGRAKTWRNPHGI